MPRLRAFARLRGGLEQGKGSDGGGRGEGGVNQGGGGGEGGRGGGCKNGEVWR